MQRRAHCPLHGSHAYTFSNNSGFHPKVESQDSGKLHAMGTQPGHKDSLVLISAAPWNDTKIMHWLSTVPLQVHGAFPRWQTASYLFLANGNAHERNEWVLEHISTQEAKKVKKWGITMLSLAEVIGSFICNWKIHFFLLVSLLTKQGELGPLRNAFPSS